jgi:hypothetical protein
MKFENISLKGNFLPFLFQGFFSICALTVASREFMNMENAVSVYGLSVVLFMFFFCAGAFIALKMFKRREALSSGPGAFAATLSLIPTVLYVLYLPALAGLSGENPFIFILLCLAGMFLFACGGGFFYGAAASREGIPSSNRLSWAFGGTFAAIPVFYVVTGMLAPGTAVILAALYWSIILSLYGLSKVGKKEGGGFSVFFPGLAAALFSVTAMTLPACFPGSGIPDGVETLETPFERLYLEGHSRNISVYSRESAEKPGILPEKRHLLYPSAVFSLLQTNRAKADVLLLASPFSNLTRVFLELPQVKRLTLVCASKEAVLKALAMKIIPSGKKKLRIILKEPAVLISEMKHGRFNLIVISENVQQAGIIARDLSEKGVKRILDDKGVIAVYPGGKTGTREKFTGYLKKLYGNTVFLPGAYPVLAAGPEMSSDRAELDRRTGKFMKRFPLFPEGMMSLYLSMIKPEKKSGMPEKQDVFFNRLFSGTAVYVFSAFLIVVYLVSRFILSRKTCNRILFCSFENGFSAFGLAAFVFVIYQTRFASIYMYGPLLICLYISGTSLGEFTSRYISKNTSRLFRTFSAFLPLLPLAAFPATYVLKWIILSGVIFMSGLLSGISRADFAANTKRRYAVWLSVMEFVGGGCGTAAVLFLIYPRGGLAACVVTLIASRLHFLKR